MALAFTIDPAHHGAAHVYVINATGVSAGDEIGPIKVPQRGRFLRRRSTLISGTGTTLEPSLWRVAGASDPDDLLDAPAGWSGAPAEQLTDVVQLSYYADRSEIWVQPNVDAGTDNRVRIELWLVAGWSPTIDEELAAIADDIVAVQAEVDAIDARVDALETAGDSADTLIRTRTAVFPGVIVATTTTAPTPGTADPEAMGELGALHVPWDSYITAAHIHQVHDGTLVSTDVEVFRRRAGVNTMIASGTLAAGGGDFGELALTFVSGAHRNVLAGDYLFAQATAVMTSVTRAAAFVDVHFAPAP